MLFEAGAGRVPVIQETLVLRPWPLELAHPDEFESLLGCHPGTFASGCDNGDETGSSALSQGRIAPGGGWR